MQRSLFGSILAAGPAAILACGTPALAQGPDQAPPVQAPEQVLFSLPAQDLAASLRDVSVRTGRGVVAPASLVRGVQAPPLAGPFTAEEAIRALLAPSGLEVRRVGDSLVVFRPGPAADASGPGEPDSGEPIVVTGTHLRGAPPSSPTIVISRREIDRSGATSVEQLMRRLPQNSSAGVGQENFGAVLPDQDVTDHGAGLNLRGLGQRATLVLLNGRRLAPSGFGSYVDVSLIPLSLVERVEILTDGASAIYGSDAVGGVVNFILRERLEGLETSLLAGTTTRGGGEQLLFSQSGGADWGSGHALLAYEYRREDEVRAEDRSFTINLRPDTFILPSERRHSLLALVEQELAEGLLLSLTGTYAHRSTTRTYFQSISPLPIGADARAESLGASGELAYEFGAGWRARLVVNHALSDTGQRQTQPGGQELVNGRDVRNGVTEGQLLADGPLLDLPGGPVRVALGAELRHETYRDSFESSAIPRTTDEASRDVRSLFAELSVPLVSSLNRLAGAERLELSLAGRFDDYGGTGSNFDPKVGLLWSPVPGLALRASWGTSFRAPLLSEIGGAYTVIYLPAFFIYANPASAPPGTIAAILQGSDPQVQPETSRTWSVGAEISPGFAPGLSLSLNYYDVRFRNRIALPTRFIGVVGDPAFEPIIDRSPDVAALTDIVAGAQLILDATGPGFSNGNAMPGDVDIVLDDRVGNTAETRTRGLDFIVRYTFATDIGRFDLEANVNHVLQFDDRLTEASPLVQSLDRAYGSLSWRARGGIGWSKSGWAGSMFVNYAGPYEDDRAPALRPVGANATFDLSLSYEVDRGWLRGTRIAIFAENLFDNAPPRLGPEPSSSTGLGYDPVNASGRGRFVSLQLRRRW